MTESLWSGKQSKSINIPKYELDLYVAYIVLRDIFDDLFIGYLAKNPTL